MQNLENARMLVDVAYLYYDENKKQSEIAKELNISRSLVSRYLTKAREEGIVQFVIHDEFINPYYKLEQQLKEKFHLNDVICVNSSSNKKIQQQRVATAGGKYLIQHLKNNDIVAVAGGTTINEVANSIKAPAHVSNITFVSIVGGIGEEHRNLQSNFICDQFASKTNGNSKSLYAPVIVDSIDAKNIFVSQSYIKDVLDTAKRADIALLGIGGHPKNSSIAQAYENHLNTQENFNPSEIVGDFCYRFIDKTGNFVDCEWNKRLISLEVDSIKEIPNVIAIAEGAEKLKGVLAVLKANLINTLIIDEESSRELLKYEI